MVGALYRAFEACVRATVAYLRQQRAEGDKKGQQGYVCKPIVGCLSDHAIDRAWWLMLATCCFRGYNTLSCAHTHRAIPPKEKEKEEQLPSSLEPTLVQECGARLAALARTVWAQCIGASDRKAAKRGDQLRRDVADPGALQVRAARLHFLAGACEAGLLAVGGATERGQLASFLGKVLEDEGRLHLLATLAKAARQAAFVPLGSADDDDDDEGREKDDGLFSLWRIDLVYALVRLARHALLLLLSSSSSSSSSLSGAATQEESGDAGSIGALVGFLQRVAEASDPPTGGIAADTTEGGTPRSASLAWAANRLLVRAGTEAVEALLAVQTASSSSSSSSSSLVAPQARARRLLPLCRPGQEEAARRLVLVALSRPVVVATAAEEGREVAAAAVTLQRLFTSVLADEAAARQSRLLYDRGKKGEVDGVAFSSWSC